MVIMMLTLMMMMMAMTMVIMMMFMVVLEHVEPPQDGCLANPLGAHHHQLGSVLLQEHGHNHNLPQGVTKSGYETTLYGVC